MPKFEATRRVSHTPEQMFALVADVESYPQFLPLCEALTVRSRKERDGRTVLLADMS
ncbi:type II toxin-antitoxin system RatA family toxin, partial [Mesorhizobium sp. M7A.F.Ca.CA.001.08.2.1]